MAIWKPLAKIHLATYAAAFVVASALAMLVYPGQYVSTIDPFEDGKYGPHWTLDYRFEHGWPFVFARREPLLSNTPPYYRLSHWRIDEGLQEFRLAALCADIAIAAILVGAVGCVVELRRRRSRHFQFTLGAVLLATAAVAALFGWYAARRSGHFKERRILAEIERIPSTTSIRSLKIDERVVWDDEGPTWLRRIVGEDFDRVGEIDTDGPELRAVSQLRHLKVVRMGEASNRELRYLEDLPELEGLDLCFANVRESDAPEGADEPSFELPRLASLRGINLYGTSFRGAGLERLPSLETLEASETEIDDEALAAIGRLRHLRVLSIGQTSITDKGLRHLRSLKKLQELWLGYNDISDTGIAHLAELDRLRELSLRHCNVTDASVPVLGKLVGLEYLDVSGTEISEEGLAKLKSALPGCKVWN